MFNIFLVFEHNKINQLLFFHEETFFYFDNSINGYRQLFVLYNQTIIAFDKRFPNVTR